MMKISLAKQLLPKSLHDEIERIILANNDKRAKPNSRYRLDDDRVRSTVSSATRIERSALVLLAFAQLWQMSFRIKTTNALSERHVRRLVDRWDAENLCSGTLRTRISYLRTFAEWIGKPGMVGYPKKYFSAERIKRSGIATTDRSWEAKGIVPEDVIRRALEIDERLALYLSLQRDFGLRVKESIELRPARAMSQGNDILVVEDGTKGGRPRVIKIETEAQKKTIEWALAVAGKSEFGRIRWRYKSFKQAQSRFYHLMRDRLGINRKEADVTAHGLRHGFTHKFYGRRTGLPTPVEGGALGQIDHQTHTKAGLEVSRALGHSRLSITGAYYGSYGHKLRGTTKVVVKPTTINFSFRPTVPFA
jgi:integrase